VQAFEGDLIDAEWAILPSYLLLRRLKRKRAWPMRRDLLHAAFHPGLLEHQPRLTVSAPARASL